MLKLIVNKDDSLFFEKKKLASSRGAPQENDAKFRFAIYPQGIRQFYENCKIAKCQTVATLAPVPHCDYQQRKNISFLKIAICRNHKSQKCQNILKLTKLYSFPRFVRGWKYA